MARAEKSRGRKYENPLCVCLRELKSAWNRSEGACRCSVRGVAPRAAEGGCELLCQPRIVGAQSHQKLMTRLMG